MTLKTLKDIEAGIDEYFPKFLENLEAEAVKRAKSLKRQLDKTENKKGYWLCMGELREVIRFNNLTEEDLKEKNDE